MLKYFKLYSIILILLISVSCSQEIPQIDKLFYEVQGPIKTMTVIQEFNERTGKEVYHFNRKGELKKIEHFNSFSDDEDVKIGSITYFDKQENQTRYFYQTEFDSKKVIESYSIQLIEKNKIHFLFETAKKDIKIDKKIIYNKENKPVKSISKGHFFKDSNHIQRDYFYDKNNKLKHTILTDFMKDTKTKVYFKNAKMDAFGNVTYAEHQDKNGKILFKWECEYSYYK